MRRMVILAALFFVALFIGSFVVAEVDASPTNQTVLKADIQMDGAVMIESPAHRSAYNFDPEQQLVEAIQPFDTKSSGPQFVANIIALLASPAANAQPYSEFIPGTSFSDNHEKGGNAPSGVTNI